MRMLAGLAAWIARTLAVILVIASVNFALVHAAPGDPAQVIAGQSGASDETLLRQLRAEYGLDKPYAVQLATYLGRVLRLDLGYSYRQQRPVLSLVLERLPATLLLTGTAFALALGFGILLGTLSGVRAGRWSDTLIGLVALVLYAMPVFWLGLMLVLVFSVQLEWLPAFGYRSVGATFSPLGQMGDVLAHLVLPAVSLAAVYLAVYARLMRTAIVEVAAQDYVKTARAKGLTRGRVIRDHMIRNAILPVVTVAGMQAGALVGGSVVVETVFAWPGLGRLVFEALNQRDYPVLLGLFLVMSVLVILINMLTDLLARLIDPRIAASARAA